MEKNNQATKEYSGTASGKVGFGREAETLIYSVSLLHFLVASSE